MKIVVVSVTLFFLFTTQAQAQVVISEVYPAPTSEEKEWIELYNPGDTSVDLTGWQLYEHFSSKKKLLTIQDTQLQPGKFLSFELNSNKLNNAEEKVTLEDSNQTEVSSLHYTNSQKQKSFSYLFLSNQQITQTLALTPPSKNQANPLQETVTSSPSPSPSPTIKASPTPSPTPSNDKKDQPTPSVTPTPVNLTLLQHQAISKKLKLPQMSRTKKKDLPQQNSQFAYIMQKKVSKQTVINAIIGGSLLIFVGTIL